MKLGSLTRFILGHKQLIVGFWLAVTVVAILSISSAVSALSDDFSVPGKEGAETSDDILQTYGNGGQVVPLERVMDLRDA